SAARRNSGSGRGVLLRRPSARRRLDRVTAFELKARAFAKALDWGVPRLRRVAIRNLELAGYTSLDNPERIADGVFLSVGRIMASVAKFPSITRDNVHE